ncbi:protein BatD [Flavobacterium sp. F-380]|uniref:Protein BatD n=1 Tax=Flavobacterium kayseriense TaxID=2764714 RepID=A0ABR7J4P3_9FLAO|nr:BatD family protein [Flavobacterium kayseriense]MBC5840368.1 protein BatD [Flavobacterium kayseriense]MBC5846962.1 protein BatD [Flavobacterium kayseriense]MBU0942630.1 BatD family protein [Bacteroidota bacterium]
MKRYLFLVLLSFQGLLAQVQFETKVSKTTLGLNERLRVDFAMNIDGDNFNEPSFDGFNVIAGPSQQVSQSWVNGRSSFEKIYSYYLVPNQKGNLTIKSATIEYNGQVFKTNPVKITVTNAIQQPKDPSDASISADDNLHLIAEVSKTNPYVNEPITVVYKLYFSNNIGIGNFREFGKPKYNDFWSQNIEIKQLALEEGTFKGERYRYIVLKKVVLYPQKSGKLSIEPLALDIDVQLPSNRRDVFGRQLITEESKRVSAGAKTITVKALPEAGKPDNFSGAVGTFDFKVAPSKNNLKNGESLDLVVSVVGKGNMKLFSLPKPIVPNALEMYDPVHNEDVSTSLAGMSGKISDSYTIIPQYRGNYPIKPIQFSYFDPASGKYKTISSPQIIVNMLEGPTPVDSVGTGAAGKNKIVASEQFKSIKFKTDLQPSATNDFLGSRLFYILLLLPFLLVPIIILVRVKKEAMDGDIVGNRIRRNNRLAKKYLSQAKKQFNNKELFYIALEKAMHNFLKAKLNIETSEMSKANIKEILLSKEANVEVVNDFIALTENCEIARYAPASNATIQNDYDKAVSIISDLEKQINN